MSAGPAAEDRRQADAGGRSDGDRTRTPAAARGRGLRVSRDQFSEGGWQELREGARELVARHERSCERYRQGLDLEHYLDVLERKPGALAGSRPLQQWRESGRWPQRFDRLWPSLEHREGKQAGTRTMIELLQ